VVSVGDQNAGEPGFAPQLIVWSGVCKYLAFLSLSCVRSMRQFIVSVCIKYVIALLLNRVPVPILMCYVSLTDDWLVLTLYTFHYISTIIPVINRVFIITGIVVVVIIIIVF